MIDMPPGRLTVAAFHEERALIPEIRYLGPRYCPKHGRAIETGRQEVRYSSGHTVLLGTLQVCTLCTHGQSAYVLSPAQRTY